LEIVHKGRIILERRLHFYNVKALEACTPAKLPVNTPLGAGTTRTEALRAIPTGFPVGH